jgi:hypothetical protein
MAKVYGIWGQSNAKADLSAGPPSDPNLIGVIPNVFIWNTTTVTWQPIQYNVNNMGFSGALNGFGVELKLGWLAKEFFTGQNIYIIKYAVSGTALGPELGTDQNWGKGDGVLYGNMISIYNQALAAIPESYAVEGIYGNQGERDANITINTGASPATTIGKYYYDNIVRFTSDWRADINGFSSAKFVYTRLRNTSTAYFNWFIGAKQVLATSVISRSAWLNEDDLTYNADNIHLTGPSQITLADRAFAAFQAII